MDPTTVLRAVVVVAVAVLLVRAARVAWLRRALALRVWRAVRPRHVVGALGLMTVVLTVALGLLWTVPVTGYGLGSLIGLEGNAVFAPIDAALDAPLDAAEQAAVTGQPSTGVPWWQVAGVVTFLLGLAAMFPHLANAEEHAFRLGWEDLPPGRQVASALRFGLLHMIMLIPLAAALAIAVAGWVYGRIYLAAYRRSMAASEPPRLLPGAGWLDVAEAQRIRRRTDARRHAVFTATVWHATFNTCVAMLVLIGYLSSLAL